MLVIIKKGWELHDLNKKVKGLGVQGRLTDATIDRRSFVAVAIRQNNENLK